jgi:phosphohistidine phosphatase
LKTLYLLRHAKSSWKYPALADFDRPLNKRGEKDAPRMADYAFQQGIRPEMIISSPALRTQLTAKYFYERLQPGTELLLEPDLYECSPKQLWQVARRFPDELQSILLVGHNTCLEDIISEYIEDLDKFPTGALATLQFDVADWQKIGAKQGKLIQLIFPKMLPA